MHPGHHGDVDGRRGRRGARRILHELRDGAALAPAARGGRSEPILQALYKKRRLIGGLVLLGAIIAGAVVFANAYYVRDFSEVVPGKLYRSRQPRGMQWSVLDRHHIAGVIDLRLPSENPADFAQEQQACKDRNVAFINVPIGDLLPDDDQFRAFLRTVRAGKGAFLVHCEHGRNRTGHAIAAYRIVVQNWTPQQAWDELRAHDAEPQDPVKHQLLDAILIRLDRDRVQWLAATDPNSETN